MSLGLTVVARIGRCRQGRWLLPGLTDVAWVGGFCQDRQMMLVSMVIARIDRCRLGQWLLSGLMDVARFDGCCQD